VKITWNRRFKGGSIQDNCQVDKADSVPRQLTLLATVAFSYSPYLDDAIYAKSTKMEKP